MGSVEEAPPMLLPGGVAEWKSGGKAAIFLKDLESAKSTRYIKRVPFPPLRNPSSLVLQTSLLLRRSRALLPLSALLALWLLSPGCQTGGPAPRAVTQLGVSEPAPEPAPNLPVVQVEPDSLADEHPILPVDRPAPPVAKPSQPQPATAAAGPAWVQLSQWCATHNLPQPRRLGGASLAVEIQKDNDRVRLTLGSHEARWNGTEFWFGFAPRVRGGELLVHRLDLEKHLGPLLLPRKELFPVSRVVVIDPGHGGENAGTKSVTAPAYEKTYAMDWARRLAPLMAANGWQVFLTRTNDIALSPSNRVAIATSVKADLFISLHFNSVPGHPEQHGVETYALTPQGMPSHVTRDKDEVADIRLPGNRYDEENFLAAIRTQQSLVQTTGAADRGARRARFMGVLRGQNCPAILIEAGYLSSPGESRAIARADYRQKLAEAVARAFP